jgi:hypothetical protein
MTSTFQQVKQLQTFFPSWSPVAKHKVATMSEDEPALLEALFHHLVLPPKLPRRFDGDNTALKRSFGRRLLQALDAFRDVGDPNIWHTLEASLQATQHLHDGPLTQCDILSALTSVQRSHGDVWLGIHVEAQNAGLIFHADDGYESECLFHSIVVHD